MMALLMMLPVAFTLGWLFGWIVDAKEATRRRCEPTVEPARIRSGGTGDRQPFTAPAGAR